VSLAALPTALLLPPVNLVPLALAGVLLARVRPRLGRAIVLACLLLLLLLGLPVVAGTILDALQTGLDRHLPEPARQRADLADAPATPPLPGAIIVLSADGSRGAPGGILPNPGLGMMTLERLQAGAILSRRMGLPLLVTGGKLSDDSPPIAEQMARTLQQDFGLSAAWVEPRATDTWENAQFSADMLRASGIRSAYLVTSGWHLRRALIAFRRIGFDVVPVASRFNAAPQWDADEFVPRISAWVASYYALHEWVGCLWYEVRH
jgi:uncharacterized SAM-binding protein YcdF (DUF218 family)